jgi:hypothetical protein
LIKLPNSNTIRNLNTFYNLGIFNLIKVLTYRLLLKLHLHKVQWIKSDLLNGVFFNTVSTFLETNEEIRSFEKLENGLFVFGEKYISLNRCQINWHKNYIENKISYKQNSKWWEINDFDFQLGDIKTVWELSRFDWVVQLAILASTGEKRALDLLNQRLNDWVKNNPNYEGVNWKCGQEASIRVMHLIYASIILNGEKLSSRPLVSLIEAHIKRIAPTISYAFAQNNNHGTSEAIALFVGAHFLTINGVSKYEKLSTKARKWLEERALTLFSKDGCFSQYSTNYHRLVLDTYSFCETYRSFYKLDSFTIQFYTIIRKAIIWLEVLIDSQNGDVPNIGANDGAKLFNTLNYKYRDYKQSVQWANLVYNNRLIFPITFNQFEIYKKLGVKMESAVTSEQISSIFLKGDDDGFMIYRNKEILIVFKRPIYKFRPSQSDALHLDLWIDGTNILRDGGSYSYNSTIDKANYYNGVASHNTIQFDRRDQMPKISRFLFGAWLKENRFECIIEKNVIKLSSSYFDYKGAFHKRELCIWDDKIVVKDELDVMNEFAILNWRFTPNLFNFSSDDSLNKEIKIDVKNKIITGDFEIFSETESKVYFQENPVPVTKNKFYNSGDFTTTITW